MYAVDARRGDKRAKRVIRLDIEHQPNRRVEKVELEDPSHFSSLSSAQGLEQRPVDRKGNAVIVWSRLPTDIERAAVDGCLR